MEKNELIGRITQFFRLKGFRKKGGNNFYLDLSDEVMLVFGVQKSMYGEYCYIESGYVFKSINKHLPYPKYYDVNLRCCRVIISMPLDSRCDAISVKLNTSPTYFVEDGIIRFVAIIYDDADDYYCSIVEQAIDERIEEMKHYGQLGKTELLNHYMRDKPLGSWTLHGWRTVDYFGLPHEMGDLYRMTMDGDWDVE